MRKFDSVIIGAGQAGPSLAAALAGKGEKVALIERDTLGGTCVNTGCTPTKTMVASARAIRKANQGSEYGFSVSGKIRADMAAIKARKDRVVEESRQGLRDWLDNTDNLSLIYGHARFTGSHTLEAGGEELTAEKFFINTGGRPRLLSDADKIPYFTNHSVMDLEEVPEHLIIIGGSYIGLEFGQMFRRFGSRVTIVEKGPVPLPREDRQAGEAIREFMQEEGVVFRLNAECIRSEQEGNQLRVHVDCSEGDPVIEGSHVLLAIGRIPNTDDLGLENTKVSLDEKGYIKVDDTLRTAADHIWALGDCNGNAAFTHAAYNDYEIVLDQLHGEGTRGVSDRIDAYALYTDPPLARIGLNRKQASDTDRDVLVGHLPMSKVARAKEKGETNGFMEVYIDATDQKILGATLLGTGCDEVIHSLLDIMYAEAPYTVIRDAVHIHPTVSELIPTMLQSLDPL